MLESLPLRQCVPPGVFLRSAPSVTRAGNEIPRRAFGTPALVDRVARLDSEDAVVHGAHVLDPDLDPDPDPDPDPDQYLDPDLDQDPDPDLDPDLDQDPDPDQDPDLDQNFNI